MLPDHDQRVQDELDRLEQRMMDEPLVKESLTKGESWPKTHAKHQEARQQMAEKFGVEAGLMPMLLCIPSSRVLNSTQPSQLNLTVCYMPQCLIASGSIWTSAI